MFIVSGEDEIILNRAVELCRKVASGACKVLSGELKMKEVLLTKNYWKTNIIFLVLL